MSSDLERQLREALHEDAQRARLVNPDGPPILEARPLLEAEHPRRTARRVVAVAAAVALVAAATVAVIRDRQQEPDVETIPPQVNDDEVNDDEVKDDEVTDGEVTTDTTLDPAELFTDVAPGSTVELPPGPIAERAVTAVVWSGTEVIVWGGLGADLATLGDGAAFDPATQSWRRIAPPPSIEPRLGAEVAWTGTEMLIWGGATAYRGGQPLKDGAAYDPRTDTWRRLADGPFDAWESGVSSVWTGEELIVIGLQPDPPAGERKPMAAYDPQSDEWRELADVPAGTDFDLVWTGDALLTTVTGYSTTTGESTGTDVWSYQLASDSWEHTAELESVDVGLHAVLEVDGSVRAVLALAHETGAPITVLDRTGDATGTLPAIPGEPATLGEMSASGVVWLGDEGVFWIRPLESEEAPEHWALSWSTRTWRRLDADQAPPMYYDLQPLAGAGVLMGFSAVAPGELGSVSSGVIYRPPTPPGD